MKLKDVQRLSIKALEKGGKRTSLSKIDWDVAGPCEDPHTVSVYAAPEVRKQGGAIPLEVILQVPCRRCEGCFTRKRAEWRARAVAEAKSTFLQGCRIWFGTLTCRPGYLYEARCKAAEKKRIRAVSFDELEEAERFRLLDAAISTDISKWLKRLRASGASCRYLLVTERHKSGAPHYHMLLHETKRDQPIRKEALHEALWPGGFTAFKLVPPLDLRSVTYVCKYLAKQGGRVRSSVRYGRIEGDGTNKIAKEEDEIEIGEA